jgi:hypothetical protein
LEKYVLLFIVNDPRGRISTLVVISGPTGVAVSKQRPKDSKSAFILSPCVGGLSLDELRRPNTSG